jgi:hypothetical protein
MKAAQNNVVFDTCVRKCRNSTKSNAAPNTTAAPRYPNPAVSANQSPSAVPSVCENMIVTQ